MFNRRLVSHELRKVASRLESIRMATGVLTIDLNNENSFNKIKNYSGTVKFIYNNLSSKCNVSNLTFDSIGKPEQEIIFTGTNLKSNSLTLYHKLLLKNFSKIECNSVGRIEFDDCNNIIISQTFMTDFKGCKNIDLKNLDSTTFKNCSDIHIVNPGSYCHFNSCSNFKFDNENKKNENHIVFENCSGTFKCPENFWAIYKKCSFDFDKTNAKQLTFQDILDKGLENFNKLNLDADLDFKDFLGVIFPMNKWKRMHNKILQAIAKLFNKQEEENEYDDAEFWTPEKLLDPEVIDRNSFDGFSPYSEDILDSDKYVMLGSEEFMNFISFSTFEDIIDRSDFNSLEDLSWFF